VIGLLQEGLDDVDVGVIEGVMGLFDGKTPGSSLFGSSAEMARWTKTPVLLVVNAAGVANSAAAIVKGFATLARGVRIAGVLFNRVGSDRHYRLLSDALAAYRLPPAVGYLPRAAEIERPSRHLGLVPSMQQGDMAEYLGRLAGLVEQTVDLDAVLALARSAEPLAAHKVLPAARSLPSVTVAYAYDAAFHFYYAAGLRTLERLGARLVPFSPLQDKTLPQGSQVLLLGGGFPELYAQELAANTPLLSEVRGFAGPVYAECGGMMYLSRSLTDQSGTRFLMVGRVPADVEMQDRLQALGYGEARLLVPSILGPAGAVLRGHEFHWSRLTGGTPFALEIRKNGRPTTVDGFAEGNLLASYFHVDFAAHPKAARALLAAGVRR
jgi:cobyrinic acid a,c-diamide synthase